MQWCLCVCLWFPFEVKDNKVGGVFAFPPAVVFLLFLVQRSPRLLQGSDTEGGAGRVCTGPEAAGLCLVPRELRVESRVRPCGSTLTSAGA